MWKTLSLQNRLNVMFLAMMGGAFSMAIVALLLFSTARLVEEKNPAEDVARYFTDAINQQLKEEPQSRPAFQHMLARLEGVSHGDLVFAEEGSDTRIVPPTYASGTPRWFEKLLVDDDGPLSLLVATTAQALGRVVVFTDTSADVNEKWVAFLAIIVGTIVLWLGTFVISRFIVRTTLRPLNDIREGLSRLKAGRFGEPVACSGPPEILRSCMDVNELSGTLERLNKNNQSLMRRLVKLQDDERAEIARDMHDELGPLLFALRANTSAFRLSADAGLANPEFGQTLEDIVEAIQQINVRILDRLRPMQLRDEGLVNSIKGLVQGTAARIGAPQADFYLDGEIENADEVVGRTIYRLVQEGLTNVFRHARAKHVVVSVSLKEEGARQVVIEVRDNGVGIAPDQTIGRGLSGMKERVLALGGEFRIQGSANGTTVHCMIPWQPV